MSWIGRTPGPHSSPKGILAPWQRRLHVVHLASIPVALVAFVVHRRAAVHQLHFRRLAQ